jgi:hypothetical protein
MAAEVEIWGGTARSVGSTRGRGAASSSDVPRFVRSGLPGGLHLAWQSVFRRVSSAVDEGVFLEDALGTLGLGRGET